MSHCREERQDLCFWVLCAATFVFLLRQTFTSALDYAWHAKTIYDVHAPKAFSFLGQVVEDDRHFYAFDQISKLRERYRKTDRELTLKDFGAGSHKLGSKRRRISDIAATSGTPARFGEYLFKTVDWSGASNLLELGTNVGIGSSYLAAALPANGRLISIDADGSLLAEAEKSLSRISHLGQIDLVKGTFDDALPDALKQLGRVDLAFIDGNHQDEATRDYFTQIQKYTHSGSVIILDDIHWSAGMESAWAWVKAQPGVTLSLDLYRWGIVFVDPAILIPQHLTICPWKWKPWHMGFFNSRTGAAV